MTGTLNRDARVTLRVLLGTALGILPVKQLFTDGGWLVDVWLTMAIVVLPAAALRTRYRPAAWQLLPGLGLAATFLTARFLPEHASFGFMPSLATSSDLGRLSDIVRATMSDQAAPVHTSPAIRFYLAAGLALLAALIDVVAVCLQGTGAHRDRVPAGRHDLWRGNALGRQLVAYRRRGGRLPHRLVLRRRRRPVPVGPPCPGPDELLRPEQLRPQQ